MKERSFTMIEILELFGPEQFGNSCLLRFGRQVGQIVLGPDKLAIVAYHLERRGHSGAAVESRAKNRVPRNDLLQSPSQDLLVQQTFEQNPGLYAICATLLLESPEPSLLW